MDTSTDLELRDQIIEESKALVLPLLQRGTPAWAISYALAYVAADLGLHVCSDPAAVLSVVMSAVAESARCFSEARNGESDDSTPEVSETETAARPAGIALH